MQSRASSPSPMSSRVTQLLFWYVVPLSENQTSPVPGKFEYSIESTNAVNKCLNFNLLYMLHPSRYFKYKTYWFRKGQHNRRYVRIHVMYATQLVISLPFKLWANREHIEQVDILIKYQKLEPMCAHTSRKRSRPTVH